MPCPPISPAFSVASASREDFDTLAELRITAMRESLERVGRFDPARARERLRCTFQPEHTRLILVQGKTIGFYATRPIHEGWQLDHLYLLPLHQGRGIGGAILRELCAEADARALTLRVGALKESRANRFYQQHGFTLAEAGEWDNYYQRPPTSPHAAPD